MTNFQSKAIELRSYKRYCSSFLAFLSSFLVCFGMAWTVCSTSLSSNFNYCTLSLSSLKTSNIVTRFSTTSFDNCSSGRKSPRMNELTTIASSLSHDSSSVYFSPKMLSATFILELTCCFGYRPWFRTFSMALDSPPPLNNYCMVCITAKV